MSWECLPAKALLQILRFLDCGFPTAKDSAERKYENLHFSHLFNVWLDISFEFDAINKSLEISHFLGTIFYCVLFSSVPILGSSMVHHASDL